MQCSPINEDRYQYTGPFPINDYHFICSYYHKILALCHKNKEEGMPAYKQQYSFT